MRIVRTVSDLKRALKELKTELCESPLSSTQFNTHQKPSIGFVPTMGALHSGHASLLSCSANENDVSVLSIFVNPTQFNRSDDFEKYPRVFEHDLEIARTSGVDVVFAPTVDCLYPSGYSLRIQETDLATKYEGQFRPGHFDGVLTVVAKLLGCVQPDRLYLGKKDYQQCLLLKKLIEELFLTLEPLINTVLHY